MAKSRTLVRFALFLALLALILTACGGQTKPSASLRQKLNPQPRRGCPGRNPKPRPKEDDDMAMEPIKIGALPLLRARCRRWR